MDEITAYYRRGGEHTRLRTGTGRLEYLRTSDLLARTLPEAPARILDVGGATGAYAGPLAAAGYRVHVVDLVVEQVTSAGALPGVTGVVGDARGLPVADSSADAVLLLGPLYHLSRRADRVTAWREAGRAVRRGGVVIGATISRFSSLHDGFARGYFTDPRFRAIMERALATGQHRNTDTDRTWFTDAYFHRPDEIAAEVRKSGLSLARTVAVEGSLWQLGDRLDEILADEGRTGLMLEMMRQVEDEPSLAGASSHLLTVAHRL